MLHFFALLSIMLSPALSRLGLDVPIIIDEKGFVCLSQYGFDWIISRAYHSYGAIDTNAPITIRAAKKNKFLTDVYLFPCIGKDPR